MAIQTRKWRTASGEQKEAYIVRYTGKDGKRHIATHERKKDAEAAWARIKTELGEGTHVAPSQSITVAEAAEEWLSSCESRGLERGTTNQYRVHVHRHIVPMIGRLKLTDLTLASVAAFEDRLRREGRSRPMCRKILTSLRGILGEAQGRGKVQRNVVKDRPRTQTKDKSNRKRLEVGEDIPTTAEVRAIIAAASSEYQTVLLVTALTGMRASEVRGLRWCDVDLRAGKIRIAQRIDQFHQVGAPKSKTGNRTIPLPGPAVQALREWRIKSGNRDGLVFHTTNGRDIDRWGIARHLAAACVDAGVVTPEGKAKYPGLHSLRHFYASWCINRIEDGGCGLPAKLVQERLGHSNISMTLDVYGHLFPHGDDGGALDRAAEALLG
jgi:integrase